VVVVLAVVWAGYLGLAVATSSRAPDAMLADALAVAGGEVNALGSPDRAGGYPKRGPSAGAVASSRARPNMYPSTDGRGVRSAIRRPSVKRPRNSAAAIARIGGRRQSGDNIYGQTGRLACAKCRRGPGQ